MAIARPAAGDSTAAGERCRSQSVTRQHPPGCDPESEAPLGEGCGSRSCPIVHGGRATNPIAILSSAVADERSGQERLRRLLMRSFASMASATRWDANAAKRRHDRARGTASRDVGPLESPAGPHRLIRSNIGNPASSNGLCARVAATSTSKYRRDLAVLATSATTYGAQRIRATSQATAATYPTAARHSPCRR